MSLQRGCQFCGRRMRGTTPGAMTILLDGQPLDTAIVVCAEHGVEIRRVLDNLRQRSTVAQQARALDVTQRLLPVPDAVTEHFATLPADSSSQREWRHVVPSLDADPRDAKLPVPLTRSHRRRSWPAGLRRNT